jgi:MerR family transcriptional regulator, redox-sensitive transcriptional activator SoxR
MEEAELSIGEVAAQAGVSVSALRYYERIGLLPAAERERGRRRFPAATVRRLGVVATAKRAGLSLAEIRSLLDAVEAGAPLGDSLQGLAERRLPEAEAQVERATWQRDWLAAASACGCASLDDCALLAA